MRRDLQLRKFSKGMLQRVGIAQALINDPELVVLDEPMSGLDPIGRKEVRDLIFRLKESGKTVMFSSHILHDAEFLCDRVAMILKGRLVACGRVIELIEQGATQEVELVVDRLSPEGLDQLRALATKVVMQGDRMLVVLKSQQQVEGALEIIRAAKAKSGVAQSSEGVVGGPLHPGGRRGSQVRGGSRMKVLSIALNTFRENLRDKLLYNLLVFALLMIGSSVLLMRLTLGEFHRLFLNVGLGSINFFGVLIAIFVGIGLVSKEIEKKTIYTIVSKPVARYQFLLGKYLGLTLTLFVNTVIMAGGLLVVLYAQEVPIERMLFKALGLIFVEFMVITAVALLFSTFTSATLSAIFTLAIYVIGHLTADLKTFGAKMDDGSAVVTGSIISCRISSDSISRAMSFIIWRCLERISCLSWCMG